MEDKRQQFRHSVEPSNVSSTSDVDMFNDQRQRFFAHPPAVQRTHAGNLERVEEEPNNMADSSTDPKCRAKHMFYGHSTEQRYLAHDGPFKKPAQQGYYNRYPITPPYYDNRYPCGNPMCREAHYCYEHQTNRDCYNPAMPVPPSPSHYFTHDCHPGYVRPIHRTSPSFMNPNHPNTKRSENELPRPKPEWPQGYRPGNHGQAPATPAQYLAALSGKDSVSNPPSTATSLRSINLEPYMYSSNFSSPRQSARLNRKRAISSSPLSIDSIDINSLIRTSPDSLIAYINAPRISSAGSYGHLSANGISPSPKPQRSPSMRSPMRFGCWQSTPSGSRPKSQIGNVKDSKEFETKNAPTIKRECPEKEIKSEPKEEESMIVDSNNNVEENKLTSVNSPTESDKRESDIEIEENNDAEKDENNNELVCLWKDCNMIFQSQDELVKHVNTDHIKKERRDFTCYWVDCQREQKPFKAQYMLVVHMRRHTGEKPNRCTYEGCNKAYSRLENLKTHERSHTGERPYVCEYENCTKAFTNASDRAKHQNRTHSSVKPYVCTVADCTKRYTDPSSLRKHKKTCHPEHFTGAKKPKIDETKGKPDTTKGSPSSTKTLATDSRGKVPQGFSVNQRTHAASGNPSSPSESIVRDQTKNTQANTLGTIQQDFSPQSYTGDLTSSSSCVDSPQSISFVCDGADQPEETSQTKANSNTPKNSSLPRSPQATHMQPFPERPEMGPQGGDVLIENPVIPNQISLPTINKQNEVGKWIADVSQRMNNASKYSSEIKDNLPVDFSSRRSSESGVSSYISSRRSSEVSTHHNRQPHAAPGEMLADEYPPNRQASDAYYMQQFPPVSQWNNNPRRNDFYDEMIRPSPIPDTFDLGQRRSSSGYGSHHNLAVIRSPVFHRIPIQNTPDPPRVSNRRMSDSIICEADSSNRYLPLRSNGNVVPRRSSEPATHYYSSGSTELHMPNYSSRQHKTQISMDKQRNQLPLPDIYQGQHRDSNTLNRQVLQPGPQPLERGQKLTHYPYSMEAPNQDHLYPHPPNYPQRNKSHQHVRDPPQKGLWEYEQQINQQLDQIRNQQGNHYMTSQKSYTNSSGAQMINGDVPGQDGPFEIMVNDMGNLNTTEIVEEAVQANGPSNMVVNDMNTLLNSLIEEDRYLEKKQGQENMTSALSHIF